MPMIVTAARPARVARAPLPRGGVCAWPRAHAAFRRPEGGNGAYPPARVTRRAPAPSSVRALRCTPHT